jgi:chromosome segregation ATPase
LENEKVSKKREVDEQARKADLRLSELQNKIQAQVQRRENLLEMKEDLKMQVAESPDAIQASISDLDASSERKRLQKTEKANEKQMRATRMRELEKYRQEVETHITKAKELCKKDERLNKEHVVLKEHTDKLERLKGKLESIQEESTKLERELQDAIAQRDENERTYQNKQADLMDALQEAHKKCSEEESVRDGLASEDSKKRRERDDLLAEISALRDSEQLRINDMRDELQTLNKSSHDYKIKLNQIFSKHKSGALGGS